MSPFPHSRAPARRRPSQRAKALSPWHYVAFGLAALLGTGMLAVLDRSQERATTSQAAMPASPQKGDVVQALPIVETSRPVTAEPPRAALPAGLAIQPGAAQAATPRSQPAPDMAIPPRPVATVAIKPDAPFLASAPPLASAPSQIVAPSQAPAPLPALQTKVAGPPPQAAEGPAVTASLSPPPPARPPVAATPQPAPARGSLKTDATAATDCLPGELRSVLADVAARFGEVTVVSTHQLNTANHSSGSIRERLHHDCKAVDIRADRSRIDEIKTYLRGRPEIGGVESYRNGVIHMDVSGTAAASRPARARATPMQSAAQVAPADALKTASPPQERPQAASPFAPAVPDRYR